MLECSCLYFKETDMYFRAQCWNCFSNIVAQTLAPLSKYFSISIQEIKSQPLSPSHSHPLPPIFHEKQPTPTHFSRKVTHSYPFFDNNDPLSPIFQEKNPFPLIFRQKRPTPTHFLTKTTHSHSFFDKNVHLPAISDRKRPTPTILILFATDLPPKQPVFTSFPTTTDFPSSLPLMH